MYEMQEDNELNLNNRIMSWFWEMTFATCTLNIET
jgi:hypothetical protein